MKRIISVIFKIICIIFFLMPSYSSADEDIYIIRGAVAEKKGNFKEAIIEYKKALNENPSFVKLYISIGNIYRHKLKNTSEAIYIYLKGLEYAPDDYSLNVNIMRAYFELGDFDNGIKHYKALSKIRGERDTYSFPSKTVKKIIEGMSKKQVISFCKEYLAINPTDLTLREILSGIYIEKRDYKNAKMEYNAMLQYGYYNKGPVYFSLAVCDYYLGRYEKALDYLTKAKQLGENVPQVYFDMVNEKLE